MSTEKIQELARDIAREQYTDDPDDPYWWDEDEDEDGDSVEWPEDPYEGFCLRRDEDEYGGEEEEPEPRSLYEKYPLDSSYYQTAM